MYIWQECRNCGWVRRSKSREVSVCPACGGEVEITEREDVGLDPALVEKWTPERVRRLNQRNLLSVPAVGSLWHDSEGYPFRWDGESFRSEDHRYAPEGSMTLDWDDQLSFGGLVRTVTQFYGPRTYQELEEDGVWRCYSDGLYGRSKQVGEGVTRFDALSSALRSLGDWVTHGVSEVVFPRRKMEVGGE